MPIETSKVGEADVYEYSTGTTDVTLHRPTSVGSNYCPREDSDRTRDFISVKGRAYDDEGKATEVALFLNIELAEELHALLTENLELARKGTQ